MATSNGLIGNFRGKLGNIVGYQYIDAIGHAVQALRAYRPDVFNPKTIEQAQQRIKITNSVAFYKAYASLLSRSYEGRKNAHACYCRQQSLAMSMIYGETPAVPKGRRGFVPAFYIVAEGSLPERSVLSVGTADAPQSFTTSLQVSITIDNATTLGELSQDLVDNNLNLLDGDTLYFLYAVQVGSIYYNPAITSLTLDVSSTTPLVSVLSPVEQLQSLEDDSHILRLAFRSIAAVRMSQRLAGAALIQSRGSGTSHLDYSWSSSMMLPSDAVITAWYSQEAFDQAIPSYLPPLPAPSDLTLNQSGTNSGYEPEPPEPPVPPKPYDAEIEYLESTGEQFINTGIKWDDQFNFEMIFSRRSLNEAGSLWGYRFVNAAVAIGNMRFLFTSQEGRVGVRMGQSVKNTSVIFSQADNFYILKYVNKTLSYKAENSAGPDINVITLQNSDYYQTSNYGEIYILKTNTESFYSTDLVTLKGKIKKFTIEKNGDSVLDLIPVRKGQVGYMYDRVSNQIFGNAGSGSFILGPDI